VDDALGFMRREVRRKRFYAGIVLDPPSFGRGRKGEVFKIQSHLPELLDLCRSLLGPDPAFLLLTCHTGEYTPQGLANTVGQVTRGLGGSVETGELLLTGAADTLPLPSGTFARWRRRAG
jgi:23S rRNA (cytosine1962-C5)-methyltransferase